MYKQTNTTSIIRLADGACIPADPDNNDYAEYLRWVAAGNAPLPNPQMAPASIKAAVWERIAAERDRRRQMGGVLVGGAWFKSDDRAVGEYNTLVNISVGFPADTVLRADWRTMAEGVVVNMTPALAKQILAAGLSAVAAIDDAAQAHKAAMEASADPATYDSSTGWPATFTGL